MHLPVPLPGAHQAINCALSLAAIDGISVNTETIDESVVYEGLANTEIEGRMEPVWQKPAILADGAQPGRVGMPDEDRRCPYSE